MTLVHSGQEAVIPTGAPQTVWVVLGESGQYSDWHQWVVGVYADEQAAKDRVGAITAAVRAALADMPKIDFDNYEATVGPHREWEARLEAIDAGADKYGEPHYTATEVPFFAESTTVDSVGTKASAEVNQTNQVNP